MTTATTCSVEVQAGNTRLELEPLPPVLEGSSRLTQKPVCPPAAVSGRLS